MGITTSKANPEITETKIELTSEQKLAKRQQNDRAISSYQFQIDNLNVEITKLERIKELNLAQREIDENLRIYKEQLERFSNLMEVLKKKTFE